MARSRPRAALPRGRLRRMSGEGQFQVSARGRALRSDIARQYDTLLHSGGLNAGLRGVDISRIVASAIPSATPFGDAEGILRAAGFAVGARPTTGGPPDPNRAGDWYGVVSTLELSSAGPLTNVKVYVTLMPPRPGDYSQIAAVTATLHVSVP